jgi:hypothetical protein
VPLGSNGFCRSSSMATSHRTCLGTKSNSANLLNKSCVRGANQATRPLLEGRDVEFIDEKGSGLLNYMSHGSPRSFLAAVFDKSKCQKALTRNKNRLRRRPRRQRAGVTSGRSHYSLSCPHSIRRVETQSTRDVARGSIARRSHQDTSSPKLWTSL